MTRRELFPLLLLGGIGAAALIGGRNRGDGGPDGREDPDDWDRRVRFICCDDYENSTSYSAAIYLRVGGGRGAFKTIRDAAPYLRPDDPDAAAAGLCGFLFRQLGYEGQTGGTMSLDPPPRPGGDGKIDWNAFGGDGDIFLINVRTRSAKCCFGSVYGEEIRDLALGERKPGKR